MTPLAHPRGGRGVFVTGTDTGVGKTRVAVALLRGLAADGWRVVGMKPVAAGIEAGAARNADVEALAAASTIVAAGADVNPYAFAPPIAPHLAAARAGAVIDLDRCAAAYARLAAAADLVVVEGAGGALVPLGRAPTCSISPRGSSCRCCWSSASGWAASTTRSCRRRRSGPAASILAGWVANRVDPAMAEADANVAALVERLPAPLVADLPWDPRQGAADPIRDAGGLFASPA